MVILQSILSRIWDKALRQTHIHVYVQSDDLTLPKGFTPLLAIIYLLFIYYVFVSHCVFEQIMNCL